MYNHSNIESLTNDIKTKAKTLGFMSCGISKAGFLEEEAPKLEYWLNKNMNGGQEEYYSIPDNKALIAQYLLLYEFSVPFGMDLKNQMTADKSDSRLLVRINLSLIHI